ncbi:hypothetical protein diail_1975 [Diaporthe ilicicola]|nr:hypothetical protein diail_1975 [Diaporthe ilicicola]
MPSKQLSVVISGLREGSRVTKQSNPRAQKRQPSATASPAASSLSRRPAAKKQRTVVRKTINQLPQVDLTAEDVVGNDGDDEGLERYRSTYRLDRQKHHRLP